MGKILLLSFICVASTLVECRQFVHQGRPRPRPPMVHGWPHMSMGGSSSHEDRGPPYRPIGPHGHMGPPGPHDRMEGPPPSVLMAMKMMKPDVVEDCAAQNITKDVNDFNEDKMDFYDRKKELFCPPPPTFPFRPLHFMAMMMGHRQEEATPTFDDQLKTAQKDVCVEMELKKQAAPEFCTSLEEDCNRFPSCDVSSVKEEYCKISTDPHVLKKHIRKIKDKFMKDTTCSSMNQDDLQEAAKSFISNAQKYALQAVMKKSLKDEKIRSCLGEYIDENLADTVGECNLSEEEERTMRNPMRKREAIELLKDARDANDTQKFLCLARVTRDFQKHIDMFIKLTQKDAAWTPNEKGLSAIENENYDLFTPPGIADPSTPPTLQDSIDAIKQFVGSCAAAFDKYDPEGENCTPYSNFTQQISGQDYRQMKELVMEILQENNFDPRLAMCLFRASTPESPPPMPFRPFQHSPPPPPPDMDKEIFCMKLSIFVGAQQVTEIFDDPDCDGVDKSSGVNLDEMATAISTPDFEAIKNLKKDKKPMDPWTKANFAACATKVITEKLTTTCNNKDPARMANVTAFVEAVLSNEEVDKAEQDKQILGYLMNYKNRGDVQLRICEAFAAVQARTKGASKKETAMAMKKHMSEALKKAAEYHALTTINCDGSSTTSSNAGDSNTNTGTTGTGTDGTTGTGTDTTSTSPDNGENGDSVATKLRHFGRPPFPPPFRPPHPPRPNCPPREDEMRRQVCRRKQICQHLEVDEQTCSEKTDLVAKVDEEWQTLEDAETKDDFNLYEALSQLAEKVTEEVQYDREASKCAVQLIANKLEKRWEEVDACHLTIVVNGYMSRAGLWSPPPPPPPPFHFMRPFHRPSHRPYRQESNGQQAAARPRPPHPRPGMHMFRENTAAAAPGSAVGAAPARPQPAHVARFPWQQ